MENLDLHYQVTVGFIFGIACMIPIIILVKRKWNRRGRLEQFKNGKQYLYYGHGSINNTNILCCTKGFSTKDFFFECPPEIKPENLQSGLPYIFYKDKNDKPSFVSNMEYYNLKSKA